MISHVVDLKVKNARAEHFYDFMIDPKDEKYHEWWPEEHVEFHVTKRGGTNHLGDEVYFDENLGGTRKLAFHAIVAAANRPNEIVWQMKKGNMLLPAFLELKLLDALDGLAIKHELKIGYVTFPGKLLDPLIKLYFNKPFQTALEVHSRGEWPKLAEYLQNA